MNKQRLMKVVEIENNYQKHRQRLMSIQHINSTKKPSVSTFEPTKASQTYKKSKLKADVFTFKQNNYKIQRENNILMRHIDKHMNAKSNTNQNTITLSRAPSVKSMRSSHSSRNLSAQNSLFFQRINNTKSTYSKIRKEKTEKGKTSAKEQLLNLLVNQLGVKPSVLFPTLSKAKRVKSIKSSPKLQQKKTRVHYNNLQRIRAKYKFSKIP